jgi:hypothetical protein
VLRALVAGLRLLRALYDELANATGRAHMETDEYELDGPDDLLNLVRQRLSTLILRGTADYRVYVNIGRQGATPSRTASAASRARDPRQGRPRAAAVVASLKER